MEEIDNIEISSDIESNNRRDKGSQNSDNDEEDDDVFFVEKILDKKIVNGQIKYKVKWQGWPEEDCTWEPLENLTNVQELIAEYEDMISGKKKDFREEANEMEIAKPEAKTKKSPEKVPEQKEKTDQEDEEEESMAVGMQSEKSQEVKQPETSTKKASEKGKQRGKRNIPDEGNLRFKDEPKRVLSVRPTKEAGKIIFEIEWNPRPNGTVPLPSYVSNHEFRRLNPRFLLDFYESKINLIPKKKMDGFSVGDINAKVQSSAASDKSKIATNSLTKNIEPEKNKKDINGLRK